MDLIKEDLLVQAISSWLANPDESEPNSALRELEDITTDEEWNQIILRCWEIEPPLPLLFWGNIHEFMEFCNNETVR